MSKSPEEIKAAVLKECERLCPNSGDSKDLFSVYFLVRNSSVWEIKPIVSGISYMRLAVFHPHSSDEELQLAYRLLNIEANGLRQQLEEAKIYRFKTMEEPAFQVMGEFANFLNEAVEADCPMITHWGVKVQETGEDIAILNIWAATTHDSPITRCKELRREIDALEERAQGLVDALEKIANEPSIAGENDHLYNGLVEKMQSYAETTLNQWKGQPAEAQQQQ